jgi:type I restriction enzyme R subunit
VSETTSSGRSVLHTRFYHGSSKLFLQGHLAGRTALVYKAILPDSAASQFAPHCALFVALADMIRALMPEVDITGVMQQIESVLDKSIGASGYTIKEEYKPLDLSKIDFDALRKFFKTARKRAEIERLRAAITAKLQSMLEQNRTRIDFLEKFQELIDEYNAGSANVEAIYEALLQFAKKLNEEAQRHVREEMSEDELTPGQQNLWDNSLGSGSFPKL